MANESPLSSIIKAVKNEKVHNINIVLMTKEQMDDHRKDIEKESIKTLKRSLKYWRHQLKYSPKMKDWAQHNIDRINKMLCTKKKKRAKALKSGQPSA